jgi:hypothetical protein
MTPLISEPCPPHGSGALRSALSDEKGKREKLSAMVDRDAAAHGPSLCSKGTSGLAKDLEMKAQKINRESYQDQDAMLQIDVI